MTAHAPATAGPSDPRQTPVPADDSARLASRHALVVAGATLLAFGLRLIRLGADSLWYDETVSVFLAGQPARDLIAHTARDIHPPGYYLLLRGWLLLAGYPTGHADATGHRLETTAAFLSLALGVLLVPLTWQLARRLDLGRTTAALAALLVALSPFGVWYGQEVRMYTLGAVLALLCLLATARFLRPGRSRSLPTAALDFALAAAAGLYTLYYFAFLLLALNLLMLPWLLLQRARPAPAAGRALLLWLGAQAGALVLYLPWLPVAWHQATNPPVPPWRSAPQVLGAIAESWGALSLGQSASLARYWPLLLLTLGLVLLGAGAAFRRSGASEADFAARAASQGRQPMPPARAAGLLLVATFGPILLILLASAVAPLYHVRYAFTFSPPFSILLAMGMVALAEWRRALGRALAVASLVVLVAGMALSLRAFWTDPAFAADDHRTAVRELAGRWRPGDVILVNAGYAYPALLTYWPLPVAWQGRLSDYDGGVAAAAAGTSGALILQTGHVDGDPDLGWGDPRSDFYALPADLMRERLDVLASDHARLWQYRIYDTVNDPTGEIRRTLDERWTLFEDRVYGGEANLRVQGYQSQTATLPDAVLAEFAGWLKLHATLGEQALYAQAGGAFDLPQVGWSWDEEAAGPAVALSLRLVDDQGEIWAQHDEPVGGNVAGPARLDGLVQPLRLPVPTGTPPIPYHLQLVVYDPQTGEPLAVTDGPYAGLEAVDLGQAEVQRPATAPQLRASLADFGPLRLVDASTPATVVSAGDRIPVSLLWQAGPDFDGEPLVVVVQLLDQAGRVVANLEAEPLGGRYPTSRWQAGELVRDRHELAVPQDVSQGTYRLVAGLYRAADRQRLEARTGLFLLSQDDHAVVATLQID